MEFLFRRRTKIKELFKLTVKERTNEWLAGTWMDG